MTRPDPAPGVELDTAGTTRIADQLAEATAPLASAAGAAPDTVQAGPRTSVVVAYLEALARATGGYSQALDTLAGSARDAVAEFERRDRDGAAGFTPPTVPTR